MVVHPWIYGLLFSGAFLILREAIGSANFGGMGDGVRYGVAVFAVGSLPVYALILASFQVSGVIVLTWVCQSFCQYSLAGFVLGWYCVRVKRSAVKDSSGRTSGRA
jgi:hypothetical protein